MKNFTKSRQECADLRRRSPHDGDRRDRHPGSVPGGTGPLRPRTRPAAGAVVARVLERMPAPEGPQYTRGLRAQDGVNLAPSSPDLRSARSFGRATASNLDTQSRSRVRSKSVHAVEFSKTVAPPREDRSLRSAPLGPGRFWGRQPIIAPGSGVVARFGSPDAGRALGGRSG